MTTEQRPLLLHIMTVPLSLRFFQGQPRFMREHGIDVRVMCSPGPELEDFVSAEKVVGYAVPISRRISPAEDLVSLVRMVRIAQRVKPDVIHSHTPKGGLLGMLTATIVGTPLRIYHLRGLRYAESTGARRKLLRSLDRLCCALAHRVICVSSSIRDAAVADGLCEADKIRVLGKGSGQGVDANGRFNPANLPASVRRRVRAEFGIPQDSLVVGFVGRIVRDKGMIELANAWRKISPSFPDAHLLIVGPFEPEDPVPAEVADYFRTTPTIHLAGKREDTPELYSAMDVVVLPTYREGFPNVPLEAAAMGLPVIATSVPGCIDAVEDGVTGSLIPPRDPDALAEAITKYLADPELRRSRGAAGRARVLRDFTREAVWRALLPEYHALFAARGIRLRVAEGAARAGETSNA